MLRFTVLAAAVAALAGSTTDSYTFNQRGTVAAPRAALHDGQPLSQKVRIEGHGSSTIHSAIDDRADGGPDTGGSAAAVTQKQVGGAIRFRSGENVDFGVEIDGAWSPTASTRDGATVAAPENAVVDVAFAVRGSTRPNGNGVRLGWVANLGGSSSPIVRDNSGYVSRDEAFLFRAALVPSFRTGIVTLFGSFGISTEADVPRTVYVDGNEDDPGVQANTTGGAFTVAAGASIDLGNGARLTGRVGDALNSEGNYGGQVDVGLAFDVGK